MGKRLDASNFNGGHFLSKGDRLYNTLLNSGCFTSDGYPLGWARKPSTQLLNDNVVRMRVDLCSNSISGKMAIAHKRQGAGNLLAINNVVRMRVDLRSNSISGKKAIAHKRQGAGNLLAAGQQQRRHTQQLAGGVWVGCRSPRPQQQRNCVGT